MVAVQVDFGARGKCHVVHVISEEVNLELGHFALLSSTLCTFQLFVNYFSHHLYSSQAVVVLENGRLGNIALLPRSILGLPARHRVD